MVGANSEYAIERFYLKYFNEEPGVVSELFEAQNIFLTFYKKNFFNKIIFRIGYKRIYKKINDLFKIKVINFKPDIIFVFKGMELMPKTIMWAKAMKIKVVNYNPDNPFIFSGRGSGNANVTNSISLYDVHLTYNHEILELIESKYQIPTYLLPFGYDISVPSFTGICLTTEVIKVCFVGSPDKLRVDFLLKLANKGVSIDVYGSNWDKLIKHKNIDIHKPVYGDVMWDTLRKYRVQLNPLRIHNLNSHAMRSFEVPGIGGIMLAPRTAEHLKYFSEGEEAFYYDDIEEASSKLKFILSLVQKDANKIREAARKRSLSSGYHYKDRAQFALTIFNQFEA